MTAVAARHGESTDPLRAALREAIEKAEAARAKLAEHEDAISQARSLVETSASKYEAALTELARVKERYAGTIAARAGGAKQSPPSGIHEARMAVEQAEDLDEASAEALKKLEAERPSLAAACWSASVDIEVAIQALSAPIARKVLEETQELETALMARREVLGILREIALMREARGDELRTFDLRRRCDEVFDSQLRIKMAHYLPTPGGVRDEKTASEWRQAREALRRDPDARLPEVG